MTPTEAGNTAARLLASSWQATRRSREPVGRRRNPSEGGWPASRSRDRRHLPEVPCLSAESGAPIVDALDCLPSAFRSQGFSPSQRFDPGTPSRLCFKSHPLVGFVGLQSFSRHGQSSCLSTRAALLPSGAPWTRVGRADRVCGLRCDVRQAGRPTFDTPPETLASELCSDRASVTLHDG
jgi:hypothetical protein